MAYLAISQAFRRTLGRLIQLLLVLVPVPVPDLMSILVLLVLVVLVSAPVLLLVLAPVLVRCCFLRPRTAQARAARPPPPWRVRRHSPVPPLPFAPPPQPLPSTPVLLLPSLAPRRVAAVRSTTGLPSARSRERAGQPRMRRLPRRAAQEALRQAAGHVPLRGTRTAPG